MKVAVLGCGTVGSGVVEVLRTNSKSIAKKAKEAVEIKYILDIRTFSDPEISRLVTDDFETIVQDPEVGVVAETMGGIEPAYSYVKACLLAKKSVVTSNKELVAAHGAALLEIAKQNHVSFLFEASVGGGIPILRPLNQSFAADEIQEITGILNGTTNFILTKMNKEGRSFEDVLKEAQDLGYAERNPAADVEGHDACRKIAILSSLAFGQQVDYQDIPTEGITNITTEDMYYAEKMGYAIKLIGSCKREGEQIFASVAPAMVAMEHPLAMVNDVFNGVFVHGNMVGDTMFYGSGAGKLPTASAVVADMIDAVKHQGTNIMCLWDREKIELSDPKQMPVSYFVRLSGEATALKEYVEALFGTVEWVADACHGEAAFVTTTQAQEIVKEKIDRLSEAFQVISTIRIRK